MKKAVAFIMLAVMTLGLLTGCGSSKSDSRTFTLGFDASFPPYGYQDSNGNYVGFDLDLAKEVCSRRGWTLKLQPIDWDSKDMELNSGAIDCIWNGFTLSADRKDKYTWSDPYVDNSQVVVVKKDSDIKALNDLASKTVVVQADSSALESLQSDDHKDLTASFKELLQVPEYNTAFLDLDSGAADAVALDVGVANYQIASRGADKYRILDESLVSEVYAIGFKLGNTELCEDVQDTLNDMKKDGTFEKIAEKWKLQDSIIK